ncbi:alpha/beta hydrolase family protein [Actinomadura oligospora]|uniref:alpha/beta hydrolase family protein n=1 Tax=Actinomadura oligospora TaxID=111804 RepID=UPI0005510407|nr:lipase family protein [Actinomadura oligospora]
MNSKKITAVALTGATVVGLGALSSTPSVSAHFSSTAAAAERGSLVSAEHLRTLSADEVRTVLGKGGFDASTVDNGVDAYRLTYRTIGTDGAATTATGLFVVPTGRRGRLTPVSYTHGTTSYKADAPSTSDTPWAVGPAYTYAGSGFAAVVPDYLGLGKGPGAHPWKDVPSETSASLDMLRAARAFAPRTGHRLDRDVLITGFSQGASSALGLARALQDGADRHFRVRAVAPISGGYDFAGAELPALLNGELEAKTSALYTAYLLTSWQRVHGGVYRTPSEVFQAPYADRVEKYFDGTTPGPVMFQGMPNRLTDLLTPRGWAMLRNPSGTFAAALRTDGEVCTAWTPRMPVRFYKAETDEQATTLNTDHCVASLRGRGVDSQVENLGRPLYQGSLHLGTNVAGTGKVVHWFSSLAA